MKGLNDFKANTLFCPSLLSKNFLDLLTVMSAYENHMHFGVLYFSHSVEKKRREEEEEDKFSA